MFVPVLVCWCIRLLAGLQKIICGTVNTLHDNLPDLHLAMELTSLSTLGQGNN